jgi:integrase
VALAISFYIMKGSGLMKRLDPVTDEQWVLCNKFNREMRDEFISQSTELSDKTLASYKSNLMIWFNWVRENLDNKKQVDIKPREYLKYQNWLLSMGHSSSDIANKRSAISSLNNYIVVYYADEYPTFHNFINKSIKKPERAFVHEKVPPTREEMEMMIETLENSKQKYKKEYIAYLKFTFETGCRRAETRQIMRNIVDTPIQTKTVKTKDENGNEIEKEAKYYMTPKIRCKGKGKSGKIRQLKFSDYSMDAFKEWLAERDDDCPYMFTTVYNGQVKQVAEATFNGWGQKIFTPILGRRFHPHCLREAIATDIVTQQGKSIETAKALLGHNSSETTKIYVCGVDEESESDELFI